MSAEFIQNSSASAELLHFLNNLIDFFNISYYNER